MEIALEPLSWDNVGDVITESQVSSSLYYELPATYHEALPKMTLLEELRRLCMGDEFAAYADTDERRLVGGGEVMCILGRLTLGYWVAAESRRTGIGSRLTQHLEAYAATSFPNKPHIEADIHPENLRSQAFARSIGFEQTDRKTPRGLYVYRKRLERGTISIPQHHTPSSATLLQ